MKYLLVRSSNKHVPEDSGIYIISCRYGRRFYIGGTFNFKDRFGKHLSKLIRKKHPNKSLQNLFNSGTLLFFRPVKICDLIGITRQEQEHINRYFHKSINAERKVRHYRRRKTK